MNNFCIFEEAIQLTHLIAAASDDRKFTADESRLRGAYAVICPDPCPLPLITLTCNCPCCRDWDLQRGIQSSRLSNADDFQQTTEFQRDACSHQLCAPSVRRRWTRRAVTSESRLGTKHRGSGMRTAFSGTRIESRKREGKGRQKLNNFKRWSTLSDSSSALGFYITATSGSFRVVHSIILLLISPVALHVREPRRWAPSTSKPARGPTS